MIYFAYGSNMFRYRLSKRVGKVEVLGTGKLSAHVFEIRKPSQDGSLKADAKFTNQPTDFLFGVLFRINPLRRNDLDDAEGFRNGYDVKNIKVELLTDHSMIEAFTYYATMPDDSGSNKPYDWYMQLIVAGAEENQLPSDYINSLKQIPCKEDESTGRRDTSLFILKESGLPRKNLSSTFDLLNNLEKSKQCDLHIANHVLNGRVISMQKSAKGFSFQTDSKIPKGDQTHKELDVSGKEIIFNDAATKWVLKGKHFLIDNIGYDTDNDLKLLSGSINAIQSEKFIEKDAYFRLIIPITESLKIQKDYEYKAFTVNFKLITGLIELTIDNNNFHYYNIKMGERRFLLIDCINRYGLKNFQRAAHCILMTYAFLSGPYNSGEGYFFSYEDSNFDNPTGVQFNLMSQELTNGYEVFTTNPFIGIDSENLKRNEHGELAEEERQKLYRDIKCFPKSVFNNICQFAFTDDKILRTMLLLINNQSSNLEMKIPVQYITLETITAALVVGGNSELKPIQEDRLASDLIEKMNELVQKFSTENGIQIDTLAPILRKIKHINSPPNADKLSKVFDLIGYELSEEEKKFLNERNRFLHGSVPNFNDFEDEFKELYYLSLRLHFMIAVLLLKKAGFSGRIINYAKLHSIITGKYLNEQVLTSI